jgi:hypothetical protein
MICTPARSRAAPPRIRAGNGLDLRFNDADSLLPARSALWTQQKQFMMATTLRRRCSGSSAQPSPDAVCSGDGKLRMQPLLGRVEAGCHVF